jgi:hypothetical protein
MNPLRGLPLAGLLNVFVAGGVLAAEPPPPAVAPATPAAVGAHSTVTVVGRKEPELSTEVPAPPAVPQIQRRPLDLRVIRASKLEPTANVGIVHDPATGLLKIQGGNLKDVASVSLKRDGSLHVVLNKSTKDLPAGSVKEIHFFGGDGDDQFTNATNIASVIKGGDGDDVLKGGSGDDIIEGGPGQDTIEGGDGDDVLWGSGGDDKIYGGKGNDELWGQGGDDELHGGEGRDLLNGGAGKDRLFGGDGKDLLVSVGLGKDTLSGGGQADNFWADTSDVITDASSDEKNDGYVHKIPSFRGFSKDGGKSVVEVGLDPKGEQLPDPERLQKDTTSTLKNHADHPLFAKGGPTKDDIFQGAVGDCYFMSRLSIMASVDPEFIRRTVVDLGDGSYAVRFKRDGKDDYVRVDGDFWTDSAGNLAYSRFGQEGAIWVPVIEKAFAVARRDTASYDAISGGNGTSLSTLGDVEDSKNFDTSYSAAQVADWYNKKGHPDGPIKAAIDDAAVDLLDWIRHQLAAGKGLLTGAKSGVSDSTPLDAQDGGSYRRGQHIYMVDHVELDAAHKPIALVLRNPYGSYDKLTDFARIYFCIGRAAIVTFEPAQAALTAGR